MVAGTTSTILFAPLLYFFMFTLDMGVVGTAMAFTVKSFLNLVAVIIYCKCSEQVKSVLQPFDREAFKGWKPYLKISLPTTVMMCS